MNQAKPMTKKLRLHRIRKGWDCPHCKMHFGWQKQFIAHMAGLCPKDEPSTP